MAAAYLTQGIATDRPEPWCEIGEIQGLVSGGEGSKVRIPKRVEVIRLHVVNGGIEYTSCITSTKVWESSPRRSRITRGASSLVRAASIRETTS